MTKKRTTKVFNKRSANIYRHQRNRASGKIPYSLDELRAVIQQALTAGRCPYCGDALTEANFSIDHQQPISSGGTFAMNNIIVCDLRCNKIKGQMAIQEFVILNATLQTFSEIARKDIYARLYSGGRRFFSKRRPMVV